MSGKWMEIIWLGASEIDQLSVRYLYASRALFFLSKAKSPGDFRGAGSRSITIISSKDIRGQYELFMVIVLHEDHAASCANEAQSLERPCTH